MRLPSPEPTSPTPFPLPSPPAASGRPARLPLPAAAALVAVGAAGLAGVAAWLFDRALGGTGSTGGSAWAAPLGAALGVVASVGPAAWALQRVLARTAHAPLADGPLQTPLGATKPLFLELAGREWARARRYGSGAALLLVDVDRFARLSEARGSQACDAVMAELLRLTAPTLRGADLITRFAESQMAVFLAQADATGALDVAERIRERTEQMEVPFGEDGPARVLRVTASVGVAHLRPAHLNLQSLLDDAQDAVLAARQSGGNCVRAAPVDFARLNPSGWRNDHRAPR